MRIAIIGGGSYGWTMGFVRQLVNSEHLTDVHLALMDVNPEALELVAKAARMYNAAHGSPISIEATTELPAALDGADHVWVAIAIGGLEAMRHDLEIPERYGIYHMVGDTLGPAGWLRAMRAIPVLNDIGEAVQRHCPNAWLINVSNPMSVLTRTPQRNFGIRTLGSCHAVERTARTFAGLAGAPADAQLDFVVAGIDHGTWFTSLRADGMDILARLDALGYRRHADELLTQERPEPLPYSPASFRIAFLAWREFGHLPAVPDRHTVENWPWVLPGDGNLPYGLRPTTIPAREEARDKKRQLIENYLDGGDEAHIEALGLADDPLAEMVEALLGRRRLFWTTNYTNLGQTPQLPAGSVVDTRCLFDGAGVHPLCSPLPEALMPIVLPHALRQETSIDIALTGTFSELVTLVNTDPLCSRLSIGQCRTMVREMLSATRKWIKNPRLLEFD